MKLEEFDYFLPSDYIAQKPNKLRDHSRMMILNRSRNEIQHKIFKDIKDYLKKGDLLVLNNTKVLPARIYGIKEKTKGRVEILLLKFIKGRCWEVLVRPGKIVYSGTKLNISYWIDEILDEDQQEEIFDYLMEAESDSIKEMAEEFEDEYSEEELRLMRIKFISQVAN